MTFYCPECRQPMPHPADAPHHCPALTNTPPPPVGKPSPTVGDVLVSALVLVTVGGLIGSLAYWFLSIAADKL